MKIADLRQRHVSQVFETGEACIRQRSGRGPADRRKVGHADTLRPGVPCVPILSGGELLHVRERAAVALHADEHAVLDLEVQAIEFRSLG